LQRSDLLSSYLTTHNGMKRRDCPAYGTLSRTVTSQ